MICFFSRLLCIGFLSVDWVMYMILICFLYGVHVAVPLILRSRGSDFSKECLAVQTFDSVHSHLESRGVRRVLYAPFCQMKYAEVR